MTPSDWLELGKVALSVIALLVSGYVWLQRRDEAQWLAQMQANIRRDVEQSLAAQETRLRVTGELKIQNNNRSWQLLRDIIGVGHELRDRIGDLFYDPRVRNTADVVAALQKLQMLVASTPPEHYTRLTEIAADFSKVSRRAADLFEMTGEERGDDARKSIIDAVLAAKSDLNMACEKWNRELWQATGYLITEHSTAKPA